MKFLHSGSTMLNLSLTGHPLHGWPLGRISNVIGDRSSGKTLMAIEAASLLLKVPMAIKPRVIYIEAEAAFDLDYAERLGLPVDEVDFYDCETIPDFDSLLDTIVEEQKAEKNSGALVILDSLDAISSKEEMERDLDTGSYNMAKQKQLGQMFRKKVRAIEDANIHLMVISQIRENIDAMPFSPKYRRSGGKALDFYASHLVWLHEIKKLKHKGTGPIYGVNIKAKVTKNKVAKPFREVEFPIIFEYGIDDIYSLITWLTNKDIPAAHRMAKHTGGYYEYEGERLRLADMIESIELDHGRYGRLVRQAAMAWKALEDSLITDRADKAGLVSAAYNDPQPLPEPASGAIGDGGIQSPAEPSGDAPTGSQGEETPRRRFTRRS